MNEQRRAARWWLVATVFLGLGGAFDHSDAVAQEPPAESGWRTGDAGDFLRPGDMIRLRFWREPALNGDFVVDEQGVAVLPLIGPREATALPLAELKARLIEDLSNQLNHQPSVMLLKRVRVLGEVNNPGLFHADPTMSLGDVIALAGGVSDNGRFDRIRVVRDGMEIFSDLDTTAPVADRVRSGDQIVVVRTGWFSRNGPWLAGIMLSAAGITVALTR